jgi:hypothetical protein
MLRSRQLAVRLFSLWGAVYLAGCFSWRTYPIAPLPLPESIPVEVAGEPVLLRDARLEDAGTVTGWFRNARGDSTRVRLPYQQEVREFDVGKTLLLTLGVAAVGVVVVYMVILSGLDS